MHIHVLKIYRTKPNIANKNGMRVIISLVITGVQERVECVYALCVCVYNVYVEQ